MVKGLGKGIGAYFREEAVHNEDMVQQIAFQRLLQIHFSHVKYLKKQPLKN